MFFFSSYSIYTTYTSKDEDKYIQLIMTRFNWSSPCIQIRYIINIREYLKVSCHQFVRLEIEQNGQINRNNSCMCAIMQFHYFLKMSTLHIFLSRLLRMVCSRIRSFVLHSTLWFSISLAFVLFQNYLWSTLQND